MEWGGFAGGKVRLGGFGIFPCTKNACLLNLMLSFSLQQNKILLIFVIQ